MAWVTFVTAEPVNHTPRSDEGAKGRAYPWDSGAVEVREVLPACVGCANAEDHGHPCSRVGVERIAGQRLETDVAAGEYASAEALVELDGGAWDAGFVGGGLPLGDFLNNLGAGTANNVLQYEDVEVLSGEGQWVRVKGRDPRRLTFGISRVNPEWPLPDPITGSTARLQTDQASIALPAGSIFSPSFPSVLHRKLTPMITEIEPPTGPFIEGNEAEYRVRCWADMSNIRQPYNRKYPPADGRYYAKIGYIGVAPEKWANWQAPPLAYWAKQTREITASGLALLGGLVPLTDSDGDPTRILPANAGTGALRVLITIDGVTTAVSSEVVTGGLTHADSGISWATELDLSWALEIEGLEGVRIDYYAEALPSDGAVPTITHGACANSQKDYTGSYVHGTVRRCLNVECTKFQDGGFRDDCWDPKASGFVLCGGAKPAADARDNGNLAGVFWNSGGLGFRQGLPGFSNHRNFWYERLVRSGIVNLMGTFCDALPRSPGAGEFTIVGTRTFGQRRVYTDETGTHQELVFGAHDATRPDFSGALSAFIPGWTSRTGQRRTTMNSAERTFPSFGPETTSVANGRNGGGSMGRRLRKSAVDHQLHVVGINVERVVASVVEYVERLG